MLDNGSGLQINKRPTLPSAFLQKTFDILQNMDYSNVISWNKEGDAFTIKDLGEFSKKILPTYFKHSNYQSFVRQLNMYDFHKYKIANESYFKHPYFKRGYKSLLNKIKRKTNVNFISSYAIQEFFPTAENLEIKELILAMKGKQREMENALSYLISQNFSLLSENKKLWKEIAKRNFNKDDSTEKMFYLLLENFSQKNPKINDQLHGNNQPNSLNDSKINCFHEGDFGLNEEKDGLLNKLFKSFINSGQNSDRISSFCRNFTANERKLNENSIKIKKNKKKHTKKKFEITFSPIHSLPFKEDEENFELCEKNTIFPENQEEKIFLNMDSPSAFLNMEKNVYSSRNSDEQDLKRSRDSTDLEVPDPKKNDEIFCIEDEEKSSSPLLIL